MTIKKASKVWPADFLLINQGQGMSVVTAVEVSSVSRKGSRQEIVELELVDGGSVVAHKDDLLAVVEPSKEVPDASA